MGKTPFIGKSLGYLPNQLTGARRIAALNVGANPAAKCLERGPRWDGVRVKCSRHVCRHNTLLNMGAHYKTWILGVRQAPTIKVPSCLGFLAIGSK